jgi:hypothetical protein
MGTETARRKLLSLSLPFDGMLRHHILVWGRQRGIVEATAASLGKGKDVSLRETEDCGSGGFVC